MGTDLLSNWRAFGTREVFSVALSNNQAVGTLRDSFAHAYTHMISSEMTPNHKTLPVIVYDSVQELCQAMVDKKIIASFGSAPALQSCDTGALKGQWQLLDGLI